ncbi:MAG TPA: metalloregulator ArsR/SmtB family transcription factor [Limnochordales bacterium]
MAEPLARPRPDYCETYDPSSPGTRDALRERLMDVAGLSELFKVLSDETRTRILYLLSLQELCVCDIADVMEMSLPAVSHHLRLLKAHRLVKYRREGKQVYYSLDDDHIVGLISLAQAHYAEER